MCNPGKKQNKYEWQQDYVNIKLQWFWFQKKMTTSMASIPNISFPSSDYRELNVLEDLYRTYSVSIMRLTSEIMEE
jgi:hypothetical protein